MITLDKVSVGYGKRTVLQDISFAAENGKISVILGQNGCGKSTLMKAIAGNLPYSGNILLDGAEIASMTPGIRAKQLAVMPQMMHAPGVSVREFVSYGRQPYTGSFGILSKKDHEAVEEALKQTELTAIAHRPVNRISGGERQRAYFAMLLAQNTGNILLDEPGAHLDAHYNKQLAIFMKELANRGKVVVAVLHDINMAIEIADRIVFLDSGRAIFDGSATEFATSDIPQRILGLRPIRCTEGDREYIFFH